MYLMIHESGDMVRLQTLTDSDIRAAGDGLVDLLDVSEANNPKRYFDGEWSKIDTAAPHG